ncbi:Uridine kinase [Zostera marina]|uniref:Uridine kinase n=1 Tax=Zostera marina TaxID=29655 RepID=A0A0K9PMG1_ZOSMR|nr:Uridine kinase [Zostera marina]
MEDEVLQRVLFDGGVRRDPPSTSTTNPSSSPPSILQSLPLHVSFDHGYHLLVKAIQELRDNKKGRVVTVGIGGPSGSGKTSLAKKVASLLGCVIVSMENYRVEVDDGNDLESIDFNTLVQNLKDLVNGIETSIPIFDFHEKKRVNLKSVKVPQSGVVIIEGVYALHSVLRLLLDIRVAVVGGVHFSLLSKVQHDIGGSCSLDYLIDSIFPMFRKHIEPDLHHAQIRINNSFVSSFREPYYKLKCRNETTFGLESLSIYGNEIVTENYIEMYLRPPSAREEAKISEWIKVRQSGIKYYLSLGDQRIVDKNFIIRPKAEFEVGRTTLGGLLALGYTVVVSYKRTSISVKYGQLLVVFESIDALRETFVVLKGTDRKVIAVEMARMSIKGPWLTKSYLEMILESKEVPRLSTPPLAYNEPQSSIQESMKILTKPICVGASVVNKVSDFAQPWTRSPKKIDIDHVAPKWHFLSSDVSKLAPMPDSYDLDRGLLLSVQAIQTLLENKGFPIIVGIGGPSGSGKTSLAHKMANIIGCEVVSLENYYMCEKMKVPKYDDFGSIDMSLLSENIKDIRNHHKTKVPYFDFESCSRRGLQELKVSEDCGVVIFEGVYALHPDIRKTLDLWIAVVGGVHSHLIARVQRDKKLAGCSISEHEIMTTVFPMFQKHIEPHLVHAHLKIRNDFDPVLSPESSLFVLKSNKQVTYQEINKVLDHGIVCSSVQNFTDIYLKLPGTLSKGMLKENDCIRVRICEGRYALLIREPITEGNYILQPKVDFDISVNTVAGLLHLGYQAVACVEASALIYQDGKILVEVDQLHSVEGSYLQIKGANKEVISAAASVLSLEGSYTTKTYLQITLETLPEYERDCTGIHSQQATKLQELVEFIQTQGISSGLENIAGRGVSSVKDINVINDLQSRLKRLEKWHTINMVLWTILMSGLIGYSFYQRKRH